MSWAARRERGSGLATQAGYALVSRFGWPVGRVLALVAACWFLLSAAEARTASADYLTRVLGRRATWREVGRHFAQFGSAVLDRVMLLGGQDRDYAIEVEGLELLHVALRGGGAILLGAHLGSFEVMRALGRHAPVPVRPLMYRRNGGALTRLFDRLAPTLRDEVIEIGDTAGLIRARECVARGEMLGILADRGPTAHRRVRVPFLGTLASFPAGPFILAATLDAPVFLCHAVAVGPRRYRVGITPFADRIVLRRETREADLAACVARYAAALETLCRTHPFQWFNFYPFWSDDPSLPHTARAAPLAARGPVAGADVARPG